MCQIWAKLFNKKYMISSVALKSSRDTGIVQKSYFRHKTHAFVRPRHRPRLCCHPESTAPPPHFVDLIYYLSEIADVNAGDSQKLQTFNRNKSSNLVFRVEIIQSLTESTTLEKQKQNKNTKKQWENGNTHKRTFIHTYMFIHDSKTSNKQLQINNWPRGEYQQKSEQYGVWKGSEGSFSI